MLANKMQKRNIIILTLSLAVAFLPAIIGSIFTSQTVNSSWYLENKPAFTPPDYIFAPVWTVLYLLIGLSIYFSWTKVRKKEKNKLSSLFIINLAANAFWSYLFFGLQNPLAAFIDITIIWFTALALLVSTFRVNKASFYLLIPYFCWISFAAVLNLGFLF
jgi:translocator protein